MPEDTVGSADRPDTSPSPGDGRLDSWKEIAAYLKRDVTTVRRWEKREGLPVHRHLHERRDSVYAFVAEIDGWWQGRRNQLTPSEAFENLAAGNDDGSATGQVVPRAGAIPRMSLPWAVAATFVITTLVVSAALISRVRRDTRGDNATLRFTIHAPDGTSFGSASLSPDGRQLAFTAVPREGSVAKTLLWVRSLDTLTARSLPDTEGATFPFWSATSDAVGFFAGGKLWVVPVAGGNPRVLHDAPDGRGGTWNRDGVIVFAPGREGALVRVAATGGAAAPVTTVHRPNERGHLWPEFLPDGKHFLYLADTDSNRPDDHNLFVATLDGSDRRRLFSVASNVAYDAVGYVVFERARQLLAQPFSLNRLAVTGEPTILADRVQQLADHKVDFSVSASGVLVYRSMQSPATRLVWRDRANRQSAFVSTPAEHYEPTLSPDGSRIAVGVFDPRPSRRFGYGVVGVRSDIWILDRSGAGSQFTSDPAADWGPVWSPDRRKLVFSSNRRGSLEMYEKDATDGHADEVPLPSAGRNPVAQSWSPDGKLLLYAAFDPKTHMDLWLLPMVGDRVPVPLLRSEFNEEQGQISPDGRWFAYSSNESGHEEVYVQRFPTPAEKWRISTDGAGDPRWRPDGKELYYVSQNRQLMAVSVKVGATFEHGPAAPLFDTGMPPHWYEARNVYDVSRDGRFLFMAPVEDDRASPLTMIVNWPAELKKQHP